MSLINYERIIMEMSPEAASECAKRLYHHFSFYKLKIQDFRPVDLIEKLYDFSDSNHDWRYPGDLKKVLNYNCVCEKGSRAEKYKNKFNSLCDKKKKSLEDVYDISRIFICLMRQGSEIKNNIDLTISKEDFNFIENLGNMELKSDLRKEGTIIKKDTQYYFVKQYKQFLTIHLTIDLCALLYAEGDELEEAVHEQ